MFCVIDGLEFATREEFVEWLIEFCEDNEWSSENVGSILPSRSLRENCENRPIKIARAIGLNVVAA